MTKPFEWYNTNYITITPTNLNNLGVYYRGADATTGISGIADKSYKGFLLRNSVLSGNTNGELNANAEGVIQVWDYFNGGSMNNGGSGPVIINRRNVSVGAVLFGTTSGGRLVYLTNNTKFLVVDGSGTGTVEVTPYEGPAALVGTSIQINLRVGNNALASAPWTQQMYMTLSDYCYAADSVYAQQVDTIILLKDTVVGKDMSNVYSTNSTTPVLYNGLGSDVNGVEGQYWLDTSAGAAANTGLVCNVANAAVVNFDRANHPNLVGTLGLNDLYTYTIGAGGAAGTNDVMVFGVLESPNSGVVAALHFMGIGAVPTT